LYTSPNLLRYNERVRIAGSEATDGMLCEAFARVEAVRNAIPLTYFEYGTLAAVHLFVHSEVDVTILEVGLGGRLDAVNAFDTSCAVLTSIDFDHMDYLGNTREAIGFEKAGIFRAGKPAICADPDLPGSVVQRAEALGADMQRIHQDFGFKSETDQWCFWGRRGRQNTLPWPALRGEYQLSNATAALAALDALREVLPVSINEIRRGLIDVELAGRFQLLPGRPMVILDVAHNPHAVAALCSNLKMLPPVANTYAVFAMLSDKDIAGVAKIIRPHIDVWLAADIHHPRGAKAATLSRILSEVGVNCPIHAFESVEVAYHHACHVAQENDRIIVFGSFHTVASALRVHAQSGEQRKQASGR
jgi:dihydrofolate synthase/folylpolyglutamate synthase